MTERKKGLFYPDGDFKSDREIKRKLAIEGQLPPIIEGVPRKKDFKDYVSVAVRRSKDAKELSNSATGKVRVVVPDDAIVNFISDVHAFNPTTDHERVLQEVETIMETPRSYIILGGDLVEGVHWGGATGTEQVGSLNEQKGFLRSLFKRVKGRVIGAVSGEHDSKWASRTGADPYEDFSEITDAPYKRGLLEIELEAGDTEYSGLVSHKLRGNSIYNNLHPPMRASREVQGHDFYFSGHTHRKGVAIQPVREKGGARSVAFGVSGTYKETDEYTQRSGWIEQKTKQLYGFATRFNPEEKKIEIDEDIISANKKWG